MLTLLKPSEFKPVLGNGGNLNWISNVFPKLVEDGPALLVEANRVRIAQYLNAFGYTGRYSMENVSGKTWAASTRFMVKISSMPGNNAPKPRDNNLPETRNSKNNRKRKEQTKLKKLAK